MVRWNNFTPSDIEYDFASDKLAAHNITFDEAVERFFSDFQIRTNKRYKDRYQLIGATFGGRKLKIIFQLKPGKWSEKSPVAAMKQRKKKNGRRLSEEEIDNIVESQADDDSAWEQPIEVHRAKTHTFNNPGRVGGARCFPGKTAQEKSIEAWLTRVIKERVEMEEVAFTEAKREMFLRRGA